MTTKPIHQKTTIYLNPYVKRFLQYKAVSEQRSLSEIINDEFAELLEDARDTAILEKRKNTEYEDWETFKAQLRKDGLL